MTGRGEQHDLGAQLFVHYRGADGVAGTAYVNRVPMADTAPREDHALLSLVTIKSWIDFDRAQGLELAYAIDGDYVLSVTGKAEEPTLLLRDRLLEGARVVLRGSSFGPPDPASHASDARPLWRARSLADLSLAELGSRLRARGLTPVAPRVTADRSTLSVERAPGGPRGTVDLARGAAAEALLGELRARGAPFAVVRGGGAVLVSRGPGELGSQRLLDDVADGLEEPRP